MNRQFLSGAIIFFYLLPLLFFISYSIKLMSPQKSWTILSLGLLLVACGCLILILLAYYWEKALVEKLQDQQAHYSQQITFVAEKEPKVTSLDSSLVFETSSLELPVIKEDPKELNLLQTTLKESQDQLTLLQEELQQKEAEVRKLTENNKQLETKAQQTFQDFADYKLFSEEQLKQKNMQMSALQQMIEDQRCEMEKRQEQIYQLDTKVHDLSYEIKTLLFLNESESTPSNKTPKKEEPYRATLLGSFVEQAEISYPSTALADPQENLVNAEKTIRTASEAATLLKKCINMAQKLTGANYYSNETSRYREFTSSNYAIDQRRLFDSLRNETAGLILVYSQKDQKLLFANNQSKSWLGWSPDKFISDFHQIIQEGLADWKKGLNQLAASSESQIRFLAKNKNGQEVLLSGQLGLVPSGLFKNYVIGVLYPT